MVLIQQTEQVHKRWNFDATRAVLEVTRCAVSDVDPDVINTGTTEERNAAFLDTNSSVGPSALHSFGTLLVCLHCLVNYLFLASFIPIWLYQLSVHLYLLHAWLLLLKN